jgi:hypothetical protein
MSKFDYTIEDDGYKCPYCGNTTICDDWGFDYDGEIIECDVCNKKYRASANTTTSFKAKPDCELNGEKHRFKKYSEHSKCAFCEICGKCELLNKIPEEEFLKNKVVIKGINKNQLFRVPVRLAKYLDKFKEIELDVIENTYCNGFGPYTTECIITKFEGEKISLIPEIYNYELKEE